MGGVSRKPKHHPDGMRVYRALRRLLSDDFEIRMVQRYEPEDYAREMEAEVLDALREFCDWLSATSTRHGLTSEPTNAFRAREELGVSVRLDGETVVVKVPRRRG